MSDTDAPPQSSEDVDATADLSHRLGRRIRAARERKGIARRVLSDLSGVSPRYLAQLEAGQGNISIGLLLRVAHALDQRIESLLASEDPWEKGAAQVAELYRAASPDTRRAVLRLLMPSQGATRRANRICLVGLRGAGKSTLGALLGKALDLPFLELNTDIETQSGMPVDEVIALYGQEGYRQLETQAIERVVRRHDSVVLAVAGGIVAEPETYAGLLASFHSVWLKTTPGEHMARVRSQGDERPMAGNPEAMEQLKSILTSREAHYGQAQVHLDTTGASPQASLDQLVKLVRERGFLD